MTALRSIPYGALYFSLSQSVSFSLPSLFISSFLSFSPQRLPQHISEMCSNWGHCWPTLSFLLFAVPYNYTGSVSRQIEWAVLSLTVCGTDRSIGITVNTLTCFCRVVECLPLTDTPIGGFFLAPGCGVVDLCLFKVIRVIVHKINRLLLLLLTSPSTGSFYS